MTLTRGQELARTQIEEIAACSAGALEVLAPPAETKEGVLQVRLSVATRSYRRPGGLHFRDRERVIVVIGRQHPFRPPGIWFAHNRFAGTPHVQWGRSICLYQSPDSEWQPADGMYGFIERVDAWLAAAGAGELDPDYAPLHPPVAYTAATVSVVARADCPDIDGIWVGRADLAPVSRVRRDLVSWVSLDDWDAVPLGGIPAVAILLDRPMPFEYPSGVNALLESLEQVGVAFGTIWRALRLAAVLVAPGEPGYLVLGAPMRRRAPEEPLRQHLAVWEIAAEDVQTIRDHIADCDDVTAQRVAEWMVKASVGWCQVLEDRPEIVRRRDLGTTASGVAGKAIALLGCGALGSAIAEMLVRAGAARLRLFDNATVKPGLLVRQRFTDADVGLGKAEALKSRLDALGQTCAIEVDTADLRSGILERLGENAPDLVVDATASRQVAHRLEADLAENGIACPLLTLAVSGGATHGSVAVRMPGYRGGPIAVERAAKLAAFRRDRDDPLVETFWPAEPLVLFQPEPGCSSPTFIGSAADVDHHAAGLLNLGLIRAVTLAQDAATMDLCTGSWLAVHVSAAGRLSYMLTSPQVVQERNRGYEIFVSVAAQRGIATELRRIARTRSSKVETGGLMFGEIDDSLARVMIDSVGGPPPDSELSEEAFVCGTVGTLATAARRSEASGGSSRFIGIWHTHPVSRGAPSEDDMAAMVKLLHLQASPPRQVVMLIVGFAETRPDPNYYLFRRDDFRVFALARPETADAAF